MGEQPTRMTVIIDTETFEPRTATPGELEELADMGIPVEEILAVPAQRLAEVEEALKRLWDVVLNDVPCDPCDRMGVCSTCEPVYAKVRSVLTPPASEERKA